jgi:hypothetical protein
MHLDADPIPGRVAAGKTPAIIDAMNSAVPAPSQPHASSRWNWIYVAGIFLLGVLCADPDGQAASVFGGGVGMLLLGFAVASVFCAWRPQTRRMIPGGAFVVALLAFALPRTADTSSPLARFEARTDRVQGAELIQHFQRLAEDVEPRDRAPGERLLDFAPLFGTNAGATPDAPPAPAPDESDPPRKS